MKPSDSPRDLKFRDPTTAPFLEDRDGLVLIHMFSYDDVRRVLLNADGEFSHDFSPLLPVKQMHPVWSFMWATDPGATGRHRVLRGLVEEWFRKRSVTAMADRIQGYARNLCREIVGKGTGEVNLASEFAYRLAMQTICGLVGIPLEREDWMRHELELVVQAEDITQLDIPHNLESFYWETVAKRLAHPQDELLDTIIAGWASGSIDDRELLGFIFGFYTAGTDTTGTSIVNAFALSAEFNELDYLREHLDDRDALARAVEEVIRYATPFPTLMQVYAAEPARLGELTIPRFASVRAHLAAANRSPAINGDNSAAVGPDEFDLRRSPNRHLGFGSGIHHCLGAALARLEITTAWRELLIHLPDLRLDESKPFKRYAGIVDGVTDAHFVFDQERAEHLQKVTASDTT